jgi:hypothetical protein
VADRRATVRQAGFAVHLENVTDAECEPVLEVVREHASPEVRPTGARSGLRRFFKHALPEVERIARDIRHAPPDAAHNGDGIRRPQNVDRLRI